MEQVIFIEGKTLYNINRILESGWTVKQIVPVTGSDKDFLFGAYAVLERKEGK